MVIAMKNFKLRKLACILSSLLLTSISSKVSCMDSMEDAHVSDMTMENSCILSLDMHKVFYGISIDLVWFLRDELGGGDIYFFHSLARYFSDKKIYENYTSKDFENEIHKFFREVSGKEMKECEPCALICAKFPHVSNREEKVNFHGSWWIQTLIPVLKKRFEQALQIKKSENLCYSVEKLLKESAEKIEQSDKDSLNQKVADLRKKLSENNMEEIKKSRDELQKNMFDVSSKLYQQNAQQPEQNSQQNTQNNNGAQGNENVYDANYKDVNENDKK